MYAIQIQQNRNENDDVEWVDAGQYADTESTAVRHARKYAEECGAARIFDRTTERVIGRWERIGDHWLKDPTGRGDPTFVKGKAKKMSYEEDS